MHKAKMEVRMSRSELEHSRRDAIREFLDVAFSKASHGESDVECYVLDGSDGIADIVVPVITVAKAESLIHKIGERI